MKKLIKMNLKQKIWLISCISLLFFLCRPLLQIMTYENTKLFSATEEVLISTMEEFFLPSVFSDYLPTLLSSVVIGIVFFSYLFSKKKVDLFHSIPVDRKHLFIANYISGVLVYVIPFVSGFVIGIILAVPKHYMTGKAFTYMIAAIVCNLIHFLFGYSITICAVMLTGNIVVAVLATGVLGLIYPIAVSLIKFFEQDFYITYTECNVVKENLISKFYWLSPVTSFATIISRLTSQWDDYHYESLGHVYLALIAPLVMAAAVTVLAYLLYMKRPSEAAGRAISFRKSDAFIRIPITIIGGLIGAWFICISMTGFRTKWVWLGVILGVVITHFVMEVILKESFKSFLSDKLQLLITFLVTSCIIGIFFIDATGYDKYLPKREQIQSAGIYFGSVDEGLSCITLTPNPEDPGHFITKYEGFVNASFSDRFTDSVMLDKIYAVSQIGVSCVDDMIQTAYLNNTDGGVYREAAMYKYDMEAAVYEDAANVGGKADMTDLPVSDEEAYKQAILWMEGMGIHELEHEPEEMKFSVQIAYELKSGKMVLREYRIPLGKLKTAMNEIYKTEEFKDKHFDVIKGNEQGAINKVEIFDVYDNKILSLTENQKQEFMDIYISELKKLTIDTISELPIGRVSPSFKTSEKYDESYMGYYIYPDFKKTLAYIESFGCDMSGFTTEVSADKITSINVSSYNMYGYSNEETCYADGIVYTAEENMDAISEIAPDLVNTAFIWSNNQLIYAKIGTDVQSADLTVTATSDNGILRSYSVLFKDGKVPQRLKKDIAVKIWSDDSSNW